jgi:hypothetical protein
MKYFLGLFFILALAAGCRPKKLSDSQIETKLIKTMSDYLDKTAKPGVVFTVKDVLFDDRKGQYYCEFRVNMRSVGKDTLGTMTAFVTHDFTKVERSQ